MSREQQQIRATAVLDTAPIISMDLDSIKREVSVSSLQPYKGQHLPELDGVRGAACLMVVLLHSLFGILAPDFNIPLIAPFTHAFFGGAGVDLFFVLSGFLIGGILIDHKNSPNYFKVFWARRATRILPVYLLLFLTFAVAFAVRSQISAKWFHQFLMEHPLPLWTYLTFTQNYFMAAANTGGPRWVGITWSLAVEEQFYMVVPFLVYFLSRRLIIALAFATILSAPLTRDLLWHLGGFYTGYFPTPARADGLMFGVLVAYAVRSAVILNFCRQHQKFMDGSALLASAALIWVTDGVSPTLSFSLRTAIFAYMIARIFFTDGRMRNFLRTKFMVLMGVISYPFYMYHQAINGLMHGLLLHQTPKIENMQGIAVGMSVLVLAATMGYLSTNYFEKPFRALGKRVKYLPAAES